MLSDNLCYYIHPSNDIQQGYFVDVADPANVEKFRKDFGVASVSNIITTHKHWDHSGGNVALQKSYPGLAVMGGAKDDVPGCTKPVNDGDTFELFGGQVKLTCFHTPCHTKGHILFYMEANGCTDGDQHASVMKNEYMVVTNINRCVFTGDTVFIGGCGRFFEGNAAGMLKAMDRVLTLPEDTKIFCGHEYTKANFEFCLKSEGPKNPKIEEFWLKYAQALKNGAYTVPSVLRDEKLYNVFMRCRTAEL